VQFIDLKRQYAQISDEIGDEIARVLSHQTFIQGPEVKLLEKELSAFCGAAHTVSCANGTDALQVALMGMDVGPGSAVFVPSFTYTATAEAILLLGARPIFVDVDSRTFNIDFDSLEDAIIKVVKEGKYRPAAIMTVDLFGMPVDYARARALADKHGLAFISDAAQGFGASYKGQKIGSGLADVTTTSFFPAKPLGCYGDGGAIFVEDKELAARMRSICQHGKGEGKYDIVRVGMNSRLDTMQAAILLAKLKIFQNELSLRNLAAIAYSTALKDIVATPMMPDETEEFAWAQYTVQIENREQVQAYLKAQDIPTMVYYPRPMHLQPAYIDLGSGPGSLPVSETLAGSVLSLPMHPYLTANEINHVCDHLKHAVSHA
jgi:UDP-2-acetamido-2-deoxy-ribo-hexuluronate aminotransferase